MTAAGQKPQDLAALFRIQPEQTGFWGARAYCKPG